MNELLRKIYEDRQRVLIGVGVFALYIISCKIASDIGDKYFPRERYMSEDFWNWKPKES